MANSSDLEKRLESAKALIRPFPDFPIPGIIFRDICPLLKDCNAMRTVIESITDHLKNKFNSTIDVIIGLDARGFLFGPMVALNLNIPFVPVRKAGKLPGPTVSVACTKEYGKEDLTMQIDAIEPGQKVVVIDDLLATGGTLKSTCQLVKKVGADVLECVVVVELVELNGKVSVPSPCFALIQF